MRAGACRYIYCVFSCYFTHHVCIAKAAIKFVWSCLGLFTLFCVFAEKGPDTTLTLSSDYVFF